MLKIICQVLWGYIVGIRAPLVIHYSSCLKALKLFDKFSESFIIQKPLKNFFMTCPLFDYLGIFF